MPRRNDLGSIQYLRGVAALLVVFFHAVNHFPGTAAPVGHDVGLAGVDVFFIISGFVMTITTATNPYTPWQFFVRRLIRIVPIYWFFTFLTVALVLLAPAAFRRSTVTLPHVLQSLFFIPHENPGEPGQITPLVKLGWTLNYEMFFYVVFALLMAFRPGMRSVLVSLVLAGVYGLAVASHATRPQLRFWANPILLEFALGIFVGRLYVRGALGRMPPAVAVGGIVLAAVGLVLSRDAVAARLLTCGVFSAVLVGCVVALEEHAVLPALRLPRFVGDSSYSIYLSHIYAVETVRPLWAAAHLPGAGYVATIAFVVVCWVAASVVGGASYVALERPMLRRMQARFLPGRRRQPVPSILTPNPVA